MEPRPNRSDLLQYLEIATSFRNHEFNIQLLRNVVYTGSQAVLLAFYAATVTRHSLSAFSVALFGFLLTILWVLYYRASLYWARYWEGRCRAINDRAVSELQLGVDLFDSHPAGSDRSTPAGVKFGGRILTRSSVHTILRMTYGLFLALWLLLAVAAFLDLQGSSQEQVIPTIEGIEFFGF